MTITYTSATLFAGGGGADVGALMAAAVLRSLRGE